MKLIKKLALGALSMALIVGACFSLTGCKLNGNTYAYADNATITLITKIETDANGKITVTETKDLTLEEYFLYDYKDIALDKLAEYKVEEADKTAFETWKKTVLSSANSKYKDVTFEFKGSKVIKTETDVNEATGEKMIEMYEAKYKKEDGKYIATEKREMFGVTTISTFEFALDANDNLLYKYFNPSLDSNDDLAVGKVLSYNIVFTEVKD